MKHLLLLFLLASPAALADNPHADLRGDVDHSVRGCTDLQTDIIYTNAERDGDDLVVTMTMSRDLRTDGFGYREYYFWIGNPLRRSGYVPYLPDSAAWPEMYSDYRVFYSVDHGSPRVALQDCDAADCSRDSGLTAEPAIRVAVSGPTVTFRVPTRLVPRVADLLELKMGFTTYYSYGACHGEDDSPDWGKRPFVQDLSEK